MKGRPSAITDKHIAELEAIGFVWDTNTQNAKGAAKERNETTSARSSVSSVIQEADAESSSPVSPLTVHKTTQESLDDDASYAVAAASNDLADNSLAPCIPLDMDEHLCFIKEFTGSVLQQSENETESGETERVEV